MYKSKGILYTRNKENVFAYSCALISTLMKMPRKKTIFQLKVFKILKTTLSHCDNTLCNIMNSLTQWIMLPFCYMKVLVQIPQLLRYFSPFIKQLMFFDMLCMYHLQQT